MIVFLTGLFVVNGVASRRPRGRRNSSASDGLYTGTYVSSDGGVSHHSSRWDGGGGSDDGGGGGGD